MSLVQSLKATKLARFHALCLTQDKWTMFMQNPTFFFRSDAFLLKHSCHQNLQESMLPARDTSRPFFIISSVETLTAAS